MSADGVVAAAAPVVDGAVDAAADVAKGAMEGARSAFDAIDFCDVRAKIYNAIADLTIFVGGVKFETLHEDIFASTVAATISLLVGLALLLIPVMLGRDWLDAIMGVLMICLGAVGSTMLLQYGAVTTAIDGMAGAVGAAGEAKCGLYLAIIVLCTVLCGVLTRRLFTLALSALGALGAAYLAFIAFALIQPMVPAQYAALAGSDAAAYTVAVLGGLVGGYVLATCGKPFINMAIGTLGAVLVAQGAMTILVADYLSPEAMAAWEIDAYSS